MRRAGTLAVAATVAATAVIAARRRHVPERPVAATGVAARNARLAVAAAKAGAAYALHRARRAAVTSETRRAELDAALQMRTAAQVAETLGHMKGALMKIGQMASYLDEGMPEPLRDALVALQQDAPPMSAELCAQVVREELGTEPGTLFAEWSPVPIAAASIGQVHRARTRSGIDVAVKVQYPGIDEAIRADLVNTDLLFRGIALMFPGLDPGPLVAELRARLTEELDYTVEAGNQRLFADAYAGHPYIHVPRVVDEYSARRVLTTELAAGARFAEVERWPLDERNLAAEAIFRFVFRSIYRLHAFNGDPHPGNYLFRPGGRVTFLDFGLVKRYAPADVRLFESLIRAMVLDHDITAFRRVLEDNDILRRDSDVTDDDVRAYFGHFYEFVLEDRPVTFSPEYASESVRRVFDPSGPYAHVARVANVPPVLVVSQRINLGLHAVLGRLGATGNFRRIAEEIWPMTSAPPSTPMGEAEAAWSRT